MRWKDTLILRLRSLFRRARVEDELDTELQFHLQEQVEEHVAAGMSVEEARSSALRAIGSLTLIKEQSRDSLGVRLIDVLRQDVRYALRTLRRSPGFAAVVVLSLSLGIGVNTSLFSILDALALRALPVSRPGQLFLLRPDGPRAVPQFSYPHFEQLRDAIRASGGLAAMSRVARMSGVLDGETARQVLMLQLVCGEYFPVLGLMPALGRFLRPDDNLTVGGHPVAVISETMWRRRFAAAPDVVGRGLTVNGSHLTIIGVAPAGFDGVWLESPVDLWVPLVMQANVQYAQNYYNNGGNREEPFLPQKQIRWLDVIGRSRPDTIIVQETLGAAYLRSVNRDADMIGDPTERGLFRQQHLLFEPFAQGLSNLRGRFVPPLYALLGLAGANLRHRLRQCSQPVAGSIRSSTTGDRGAALHRRQSSSSDSTAAHRKRPVGDRVDGL
ncbi:MAG: hypothetical protein DMF89_16125 [Acidobacteria bacterium]|nr:MAG: hypothetical protein DMF89_16125 [Acidobacteriota bacterium]